MCRSLRPTRQVQAVVLGGTTIVAAVVSAATAAVLAPVVVLAARTVGEQAAARHAGTRGEAGVGTIVSLMLPYVLWIFVLWTALFALWKVLGLPWGF